MIKMLREALEGYVFDPGIVDLVLWFPHLGWVDFSASLVVVLCWRWVSDRIEQAAARHLRRVLARSLVRLAILLRPKHAARFQSSCRLP